MTTFLEADDGSLVNVANIVRIRENSHGDLYAKLNDDTLVTLAHSSLRGVLSLVSTTIPAQPGFELLGAIFEDGGTVWFDCLPIIGWHTNEFGGAEPIAATDEALKSTHQAIRFPDGRVEMGLEVYENVAEWRQKMAELALRAHQAKSEERKSA
jgi:hypothetical protein